MSSLRPGWGGWGLGVGGSYLLQVRDSVKPTAAGRDTAASTSNTRASPSSQERVGSLHKNTLYLINVGMGVPPHIQPGPVERAPRSVNHIRQLNVEHPVRFVCLFCCF